MQFFGFYMACAYALRIKKNAVELKKSMLNSNSMYLMKGMEPPANLVLYDHMGGCKINDPNFKSVYFLGGGISYEQK